MSLDTLIDKIIPPRDYKHRNGFNNIPLIENLKKNEKLQLEDLLIDKLLIESGQEIDTLVVETLAYLKSQKSVPTLKQLLNICNNEMTKLKIASSIFEINQDNNMIDIAIRSFRILNNDKNPYYVYTLPTTFDYLIKFKSSKVNSIIEEYINHKEYLIAYNAKRVLKQ
ncbi:MAG: hypothetical protein KGZ87_00495 [Bacteroidetes bacterium]|nr:hypothetical protein [Bacteroidota bacterium]